MSFEDTLATRWAESAKEQGLSSSIRWSGYAAVRGVVAGTTKLAHMGAKETMVNVIDLAKSTPCLTVGYIASDYIDARFDKAAVEHNWSSYRTELLKVASGTTACTVTELVGGMIIGSQLPSAAVLVTTGFLFYGTKRIAQFCIDLWNANETYIKET